MKKMKSPPHKKLSGIQGDINQRDNAKVWHSIQDRMHRVVDTKTALNERQSLPVARSSNQIKTFGINLESEESKSRLNCSL